MKNLISILATLILFIGLHATAQSLVDGKYSSTFGNISMTTEYDKEFPNGSLIYGDYKESGTISGSYANFEKEIKGTFFNGSSEGKYIFILPFALSANKPISNMNGFWGYTSDNKNDTNTANHWNITAKTGSSVAIKNETNVWSGTWNTSDGDMHLVQVGKNVTGRYKGIGTVTAIYNPSTRLLKGTFLNQNINKKGYIEFYFEGNTFKGKWGWNANMTEGNWDGTKYIKNNKELSKAVAANTTTSPVNSQSNSNSQKDKYRIAVSEIDIDVSELPIAAASQYWAYYGFAGIKVYRVTNSGREEIKSFGNKSQYFFEKLEDNAFENNSKTPYTFSETPEYYRDFEINKSDLNNPNVKIEVELWHHIKVKVAGPNGDYEKIRETLTLERLIQLQNFTICKICGNGVRKNGKGLYLKYKIKKA